MKRCLKLAYLDKREPDEVYPLDDDESAVSCFSMLSMLEDDEEGIELSLITLTDEEWADAVAAGEELDGEGDDFGDEET